MDNIDVFKLLQSPPLIILAIIIFFLFTKKEYFSKLGREATSKIVSYTFYSVLVMATVSVIIPVLSPAIGGQYTAMLVFAIVAFLVTAEIIKKSLMSDRVSRQLFNAEVIKNDKIEPEVGNSINIKVQPDFQSIADSRYNIMGNENHGSQLNIIDQLNELLLYKKAMLEDTSESWLELIQATENYLDVQDKINIVRISLQQDSIKNDTSKYVRMLSKLGNLYLDNHEPLMAITTFEQSLVINTTGVCPACLVYDCISLGKTYAEINKIQASKAMFEKARAYYTTITDNLDIEIDQKTSDLLNEIFSNSPTPAQSPA